MVEVLVTGLYYFMCGCMVVLLHGLHWFKDTSWVRPLKAISPLSPDCV